VRDRYVWQILLATLGCGLLLGAVAIVDTPNDWSQPVCDKRAKPAEAALRLADLKDDCDLPVRVAPGETERPGWQNCEKADSSLRGLRSK